MEKVFDKEKIEGLSRLLSDPKDIVIVVHSSPDGDALGSSCSLGLYLSRKGHSVNILCPDEYPEYLGWIPGVDMVHVFNKEKSFCKDKIEKAGIIFMLDHNNFSREGFMEELIKKHKSPKVMIDHHPNPISEVDYVFSTINVTSTSEMVYEFVAAMGDVEDIDKDMATGIYIGINTDTGGLSYNSSFPQTYRIVADLLEKGIDKPFIHEILYNTFSYDRMRLLGYSLSKKMKVYPESKAAVIVLTKKEFEEFSHKEGDTEGLVNIPLNMKDVMVSVLVTEKDNLVKLSFRSKRSIPINKFASEHYNGGGHLNAAGGRTKESIDVAVKKLEELLPLFAKEYYL